MSFSSLEQGTSSLEQVTSSLEQGTSSSEANLESQQNPSITSENSEYQIMPVKPRKVIAKMKANNRKGYKRKVLEITPIIYQQIQYYNRYMLYGNLEMESYYKDYSSPYEKELIDWTNNLSGVTSIEKSIVDQNMTINLFQKAQSGIRDFQFLVNHYASIPDINYQQLSQNLSLYQKKVVEHIEHTSDINMKLKQRLLSHEEVVEAFNKYKMLFEEYVKSEVSGEEFYLTSLGQLNLEYFEIEQLYTRMSFALLSLVGIEHRNFEMVVLRNTSAYLEQFGQKRMRQALFGLETIVSEKYEFTLEDEYQTMDNITFFGVSEVKIFVWEDRPKWMNVEDSMGVLVKINIPLAQLKAILEIRSQMSPQKQLEYGLSDDDYHFEYTVESEIFLEKFYPELFGKNIIRQSLDLKKELLDEFALKEILEQPSQKESQKIEEEVNTEMIEEMNSE